MATEPGDFVITREDAGDVHVVRVVGEFGLDSNAAFEQTWRESVVPAGRPTVLDLSGVRFMDSMGLTTVLTSLREAWGRGQALLLAGPLQPPVASLLSIANVDRLLVVHPDVESAVAVLDAGG